MEFNREKFKMLVHYICWQCRQDPSKLGAVKLNKILWIADFEAYRRRGEPITGARYVKRQFGPVPGPIMVTLKELEAEGVLVQRESQFHGFKKREFSVLAEARPIAFDHDELTIVDEAINRVCEKHTARSISEHSHDHIWQAANDGEPIPYFTIFAIPGEIAEDELAWAKTELESVDA